MKINKVKASSVNLDTNALGTSPWDDLEKDRLIIARRRTYLVIYQIIQV